MKDMIYNNLLTFCCNKGIIDYYKTSEYLSDLMCMDEEKWNKYYKFCFVRNPYDRAVSGWNYNIDTNKLNIDFLVYLKMKNIVSENEYWHLFLPQYESVIDENGNYFVDFVGKFENLEEDFTKILNNIGITDIVHDIDKKKNVRNHSSYKKYYEQESLDIINEIYEKDFEIFGYKKFLKIEDFLNSEE